MINYKTVMENGPVKFSQFRHNLRSNPSMIHPRYPQGIVSRHSLPSNHCVLKAINHNEINSLEQLNLKWDI